MAATLKLLHQEMGQVLSRSLAKIGVLVRTGKFTYADTTPKELFKLPKGAVVLDGWVDVTTAFSASATIDVGIKTTDEDAFIDGGNPTSAGRVAFTKAAAMYAISKPGTGLAAESTVVAKAIAGNGLTAGEGHVVILYQQASDQ